MINVRIKLLPPAQAGGKPRAVTTKVFLRDEQGPDGYCRALEPNEVVALEDNEARRALAALPYELEMTVSPPTRPLLFSNADEALMTSQFFAPNSAGRAEQARLAMQKMQEDLSNPQKQQMVADSSALDAREAAIRAREIELGLIEDPNAFEEEAGFDDDDDAPASNNMASPAELAAHQQNAVSALAKLANVDPSSVDAPALMPQRVRAAAAVPATTAPAAATAAPGGARRRRATPA